MKIESFSGTHPYKPECVAFSVELDWHDYFDAEYLHSIGARQIRIITHKLVDSICPRCDGPLDLSGAAGSRVTTCRCIPICPSCGSDEANQMILGKPYSRLWQWPTTKGWKTRRHNKVMESTRVEEGVLAYDTSGKPIVVTETGVGELQFRPNPGGWMEYGWDEEEGR